MSNNALTTKRTAPRIIPQIGILFLTLAVVACAPISSTPQSGAPVPDPTEDVIDTAGIDTLGGNIVEDDTPPEEEPTVDDTPALEDEPMPDGPSEVEEAPEMDTDPVVDDEPLANDDPVVPDNGDADNDAPAPPASAQTWKENSSDTSDAAAVNYFFSESGALERVEFELTDEFADVEGFEWVNHLVPVGVETEMIRQVTVDENSALIAEERFYFHYAHGELLFSDNGTVTYTQDITFRTDTYFSSPSNGVESTLLGSRSFHEVSITTGMLSSDGTTIVWISRSDQTTSTAFLVGFPPQENSSSLDQTFADGESPTWMLVADEPQ